MGFKSLLASLFLISAASAQLSGSVGPTTSLSAKQATICNVLNYGGSIGSSDIGPAIASAFTVCTLVLHVPAPLMEVFAPELCSEELWFYPLRPRWLVPPHLPLL